MTQGTILVPKAGKLVSVEVPDPGKYLDPISGSHFNLMGFLGSHTGPGYAMSGWPVFWERLVPTDA